MHVCTWHVDALIPCLQHRRGVVSPMITFIRSRNQNNMPFAAIVVLPGIRYKSISESLTRVYFLDPNTNNTWCSVLEFLIVQATLFINRGHFVCLFARLSPTWMYFSCCCFRLCDRFRIPNPSNAKPPGAICKERDRWCDVSDSSNGLLPRLRAISVLSLFAFLSG